MSMPAVSGFWVCFFCFVKSDEHDQEGRCTLVEGSDWPISVCPCQASAAVQEFQ